MDKIKVTLNDIGAFLQCPQQAWFARTRRRGRRKKVNYHCMVAEATIKEFFQKIRNKRIKNYSDILIRDYEKHLKKFKDYFSEAEIIHKTIDWHRFTYNLIKFLSPFIIQNKKLNIDPIIKSNDLHCYIHINEVILLKSFESNALLILNPFQDNPNQYLPDNLLLSLIQKGCKLRCPKIFKNLKEIIFLSFDDLKIYSFEINTIKTRKWYKAIVNICHLMLKKNVSYPTIHKSICSSCLYRKKCKFWHS